MEKMMKKSVLYILLGLSIAIIANSCKDDDSPVKTRTRSEFAKDYLPRNVGAEFVFNEWELDQNNRRIQPPTAVTEKYIGMQMYAGKEAKVMVSENNGQYDTVMYYANDTEIYMRASDVFQAGGTDNPFGDLGGDADIGLFNGVDWIKIADFKNSKWDVFQVDDIEIDLGVASVTVSVKADAIMYMDEQRLSIDNKDYFAVESVVNTTTNIRGSLFGFPINIDIENKINLWYSADLGVVRSITPSSKSPAVLPGVPQEDIPGLDKTLISFKLN